MSLAHFLITRFNLRRDAADTRAIDPAWLKGRFDLFDRFCYPTVRNQTNQDFRWLVLFDTDTPEPARTRIRDYQRWPNFIPVYFDAGSREQAKAAVAAQLEGKLGEVKPTVLATTRLDNDDAVCRTFTQDIRNHAHAAEPTLIEFPVGYVWHRDRIYLDRQPRNPFTTLVEPLREAGGFRTVFGTSHHDIGRGCRLLEPNLKPSWVQVIHGGNVANRQRGIRQSIAGLSESFAIEDKSLLRREGRFELGLDVLRSTIKTGINNAVRAARDYWRRPNVES